jgi:hypothetical protein
MVAMVMKPAQLAMRLKAIDSSLDILGLLWISRCSQHEACQIAPAAISPLARRRQRLMVAASSLSASGQQSVRSRTAAAPLRRLGTRCASSPVSGSERGLTRPPPSFFSQCQRAGPIRDSDAASIIGKILHIKNGSGTGNHAGKGSACIHGAGGALRPLRRSAWSAILRQINQTNKYNLHQRDSMLHCGTRYAPRTFI